MTEARMDTCSVCGSVVPHPLGLHHSEDECAHAVARLPYVRVQGKCPNGCGDTLELNQHGQVSCGHVDCPDPHAVQIILDHDEPNHIVRITEDGWIVKHPLLERVEDKLFDCALGKSLAMFPPPKGHWRPGDYEVTVNDDGSLYWTEREG